METSKLILNGKTFDNDKDYNNAVALNFLSDNGIRKVTSLSYRLMENYENENIVVETINALDFEFRIPSTGNSHYNLENLGKSVKEETIVEIVVTGIGLDKVKDYLAWNDLNSLGLKAIGSHLSERKNETFAYTKLEDHIKELTETVIKKTISESIDD